MPPFPHLQNGGNNRVHRVITRIKLVNVYKMLRIVPDTGIVLCRCLFKNSNQAAGPRRKCVGRARADLGFQSCGGGGAGGTNEGLGLYAFAR